VNEKLKLLFQNNPDLESFEVLLGDDSLSKVNGAHVEELESGREYDPGTDRWVQARPPSAAYLAAELLDAELAGKLVTFRRPGPDGVVGVEVAKGV
jgi:hypothetical protein